MHALPGLKARLSEAGPVHLGALALVWLTMASGAVVFSEPAPFDLLMLGLIGLLPAIGLVTITPSLLLFLGWWIVIGAMGLLAAATSEEIGRSATHSAITLYLALASFVVAAFVARRPASHTGLILHAYLWAAFIAAVAGVVGYFGAFPGAQELFTKYGRAAGTFKDPNVYGPFLVPALIYALHQWVRRPLRQGLVPLVMLAFLTFAILLSFSRGAWVNAALGIGAYGYLSFVTSDSHRFRLKLLLLALASLAAAVAVVAVALQFESVSKLFEQRASLDQGYDHGPEGRFGGHEKARQLILQNPLGIGALQFGFVHHHEDVHNVFLSMFLNHGWVGGIMYGVGIVWMLVLGLRHAFRRAPAQPLYLVVYASFLAVALEGWIIDTDHWRHFFLLMGLAWGLMIGDRLPAADPAAQQRSRFRDARVPRLLPPARGLRPLLLPAR